MKQIEAQIVSYDRGIVENIRQNTQWSTPMNSVLWICNYNPNLENFTAILRPGSEVIKDYDKITLPTFLVNEPGINKCFDFHDLDVMEVTQPKYNKQYILFVTEDRTYDDTISDSTKTMVVSYCKRWDVNKTILKQWYNAVKYGVIGNDLNLVGEGKNIIPGTYSDKTRYSETILFTTLLKNLEENAAQAVAVYQFKFINYYNLLKEEKLLKGIDFSYITNDIENNKHYTSNWVVKESSLDLSKSVNVREASREEVENNSLEIYTDDQIIVIFKELSFGQFEYDTQDRQNNSWKCLVNNGIINYPDDTVQFPTPSAISCTIDIPKYTAYEDALKTLWHQPESFNIINSQYAEISGFNKNDATDSEHIVVANPFFKDGKRFVATGNWNLCREENGIVTFNVTALHYIVNYKELQIPRIWVLGEKIPYVLTAKINGIEQVIYSGVYTVGPDITDPNDYNEHFFLKTGNIYVDPLSSKYAFFSGNHNWLDIANYHVFNPSVPGHITDWRYHRDGILVYLNGISPNSMATRYKGFMYSPHVHDYVNGTSTEYYDIVGPVLYMNIAISDNFMKELLQREVSEISLYVTQAKDESTLRSVNVMRPTAPPAKYYGMPDITEPVKLNNEDNIDLSKFRLVKTYVISGDSTAIDYKRYKGEPTRTNAWDKKYDGNDAYYYYPVATKDSNDINGGDPDPGNAVLYGGTPDFILWDYPISQPLLLNGSGKYWNGKGARLVEVIQGRTFIAGCMDKYNVEETGIVRYSVTIGGNSSPDLFYEEDYLIIGHLPITAMIMFREQAIWFNREEFYRIVFPNIADATTWEFLDAEKGQGALNQKVVCATPYGIIFANESGIWMTDGGKAKSLTDVPEQGIAVTGLYQALALGTNQNRDISITNMNDVVIDEKLGYNAHLELHYDSQNDELVVQTMARKRYDMDKDNLEKVKLPLDNQSPDHEDNGQYGLRTEMNTLIKLIFSFNRKNWRAEEYLQPTYQGLGPIPYETTFFTTPNKGKMAFSDPSMHQGFITQVNNTFYTNIVKQEINNTTDNYPLINGKTPNMDIIGEIITHEIGDGKNDISLQGSIIECTSNDTTYDYNASTIQRGAIQINDPFFGYELRNRETQYDALPSNITETTINTPTTNQTNNLVWEDIFKINFEAKAKGQINPFRTTMQTPPMNNTTFGETGVGRESFSLLAPMRSHGRRIRFRWISKRINKLKSIVIKTILHKRRAY